MRRRGKIRHERIASSSRRDQGHRPEAVAPLRHPARRWHHLQAYVTELTYLLFLTLLAEAQREAPLPADARWASLTSRQGEAMLTQYRALLLRLGTEGTGTVRTIFTDAQTSLRKPTNLHELVTHIGSTGTPPRRRA